jgi:hypothetical protein
MVEDLHSPGSTGKGIGGPFPLVHTVVVGSANRRLFFEIMRMMTEQIRILSMQRAGYSRPLQLHGV